MTKYINPDRLLSIVSKVVSFIDQGQSNLTEHRFQYRREQIRSRDGDFGGSSWGGVFVDTQTNLTLFVDYYTHSEKQPTGNVVASNKTCYLYDVWVVDTAREQAVPRIGDTVDEREYRACLKQPQTPQEIEAAAALFEKMKAIHTTSPSQQFVDRRGHTPPIRTGAEGLLRLILN